MRKIIYFCDYDGKELGDKTHISVEFGQNSGWAEKIREGVWKHIKTVRGRHQFCNGQCLLRFFKALKKNTTGKVKILKVLSPTKAKVDFIP